MASANQEKIKELLGNGLSNEIVATAVGVHPSYITQLMSDEQFSAEVVAKRTQTLTSATMRDRNWDSVEDSLLARLSETVEQGMIYKPRDLLRALQVTNMAKRRGTSAQESLVVNNTVVQLNLPTVVVHAYKKNYNGEVVEVTTEDGKQQTLVTMPAVALMQELAAKNKENKNYEEVRKYLPAGHDFSTEVKD